MVQNKPNKRGRPRAYDPETALAQATDLFWGRGYAETSLDDLVQATGMNRPSLYGAFGDKKTLYLTTLARYRDANKAAIDQVFGRDESLRAALTRFYRAAIDIYTTGADRARGCFLIGTATTEAVAVPEIRDMLREALKGFDRRLEERMRLARDRGDLPPTAAPDKLAKLAGAALHSIAIRARAGETRPELEATAAAVVELICGAEER